MPFPVLTRKVPEGFHYDNTISQKSIDNGPISHFKAKNSIYNFDTATRNLTSNKNLSDREYHFVSSHILIKE